MVLFWSFLCLLPITLKLKQLKDRHWLSCFWGSKPEVACQRWFWLRATWGCCGQSVSQSASQLRTCSRARAELGWRPGLQAHSRAGWQASVTNWAETASLPGAPPPQSPQTQWPKFPQNEELKGTKDQSHSHLSPCPRSDSPPVLLVAHTFRSQTMLVHKGFCSRSRDHLGGPPGGYFLHCLLLILIEFH